MMTTRDLLNHNVGKGDKNRSQFNESWRQNYDAIFRKKKSRRKVVKVDRA